jgi:hypothetical protein
MFRKSALFIVAAFVDLSFPPYSLNAEKTQYMQFVTETISLIDLHIMYKNNEIANTCNTKFLVLTLDNTFSWKTHIDAKVPKLSSAYFAVKAVKPFLSQESQDGILLLLSLHNDLWISILGQFLSKKYSF